MNIYESNTNSFNNNGLGFLTDLLTANVTENLNGDMYLEFTYPINGALSEYIVQENIVKCNVGNNNYQLFRIKRVVKDYTRISVYALHIFYDLLDNFLLDVAPTNQTCTGFGEWILNHTNFANNFTFYSDISGSKSARYVRRNPVEAILGDIDNSMINLFNGDLERDNFTIKMLAYRGKQTPIKLIFGKNIKEIKITQDNTSIVTRVLPLGFDGLMIPEVYVDSPLIDDYNTPKISKVEFNDIKYDPEDEEAYHTLEEAEQALRDAVNQLYAAGIDKPSINIKIDWLELSKTEEYKNYRTLESIQLGDAIETEILGLIYFTRIIKTTYNVLTDTIDKFEIGSISKTITKSVNSNAKAIESINVPSILESAKNNATQQITSAMGGYVYKTQNELFIMDTNDLATAQRVWRWNLNGLGYSSNGVNGDYQLAILQDGSINADFITTGGLDVNLIQGLSEIIANQQLQIDILNDKEPTSVRTTEGFTFNNDGLNITKSDTTYNTQINNEGTYYKDGTTIVAQTTKDGSKFKDMDLFGTYRYGKNSIDDEPMFIAQLYTDANGEECFGHFYNGG